MLIETARAMSGMHDVIWFLVVLCGGAIAAFLLACVAKRVLHALVVVGVTILLLKVFGLWPVITEIIDIIRKGIMHP